MGYPVSLSSPGGACHQGQEESKSPRSLSLINSKEALAKPMPALPLRKRPGSRDSAGSWGKHAAGGRGGGNESQPRAWPEEGHSPGRGPRAWGEDRPAEASPE